VVCRAAEHRDERKTRGGRAEQLARPVRDGAARRKHAAHDEGERDGGIDVRARDAAEREDQRDEHERRRQVPRGVSDGAARDRLDDVGACSDEREDERSDRFSREPARHGRRLPGCVLRRSSVLRRVALCTIRALHVT
jgi:hypothetical protein